MSRVQVHGRSWELALWVGLSVLAGLFVLLIASQLAGADVAKDEVPKSEDEPVAVYIVAPWEGVFYAGEYAGAPPFVEVGSRVEAGTIVCCIESMKIDKIPAMMSGMIVHVMVGDGQMVAAGQPLFQVLPGKAPDTQ